MTRRTFPVCGIKECEGGERVHHSQTRSLHRIPWVDRCPVSDRPEDWRVQKPASRRSYLAPRVALGFRYGSKEIRRISFATRLGTHTCYSPPMKNTLLILLSFSCPAAFPIYPQAPFTSSMATALVILFHCSVTASRTRP